MTLSRPHIGLMPTILAIGLLACLSGAEASPASGRTKYLDIYRNDSAGRGVAEWTHIVWIGPQTKPMPLIWLSRKKLRRIGFLERSIVLSPSQYRRVERVAIGSYAARPVRTLIDGTMGAFRVTRKMRSRRPHTYFLSAAGGCGYLARILTLDGIAGTASSDEFGGYAVMCEIAGVPLP